MASPEDITSRAGASGTDLSDDSHAGLKGGTIAPTEPSLRPTLPLVDYHLTSVPAEAERRANLLSRVTVDSNGVAHCTDDKSGTETYLAAVRISDSKDAVLAPLVADSDQLSLVLPSDRPSRIGFFVGYSSTQEAAGVLRMGLYPGVPLTTQAVTDDKTREVMYGLGGIKDSETDELRWAEQVGLYTDLGFDPTHTRGMFDKHHRPDPTSDNWKVSPLVIVPAEIFDMVRHYNPDDVKKDEFQIQFYGIKLTPSFPEFPNALHRMTLERNDTPSKGGLGIGFGEAVSRTAQTRGTDIDSLQGAFKVIVVPQQ